MSSLVLFEGPRVPPLVAEVHETTHGLVFEPAATYGASLTPEGIRWHGLTRVRAPHRLRAALRAALGSTFEVLPL